MCAAQTLYMDQFLHVEVEVGDDGSHQEEADRQVSVAVFLEVSDANTSAVLQVDHSHRDRLGFEGA